MSPNEPGSDGKPRQTAINAYWAIYGGWAGLAKSPFLWLAIILTIVCYPFWSATENGTRLWTQSAIAVVPGLLGFSLGGMAILLALSSARLLKAIRSGGKPDSLFMKTVASFFHFILLQTSAICAAFISKAFSSDLISFCGFFLMAYGTLVAIAVAWNLFDIARIFNATANLEEPDEQDNDASENPQGGRT